MAPCIPSTGGARNNETTVNDFVDAQQPFRQDSWLCMHDVKMLIAGLKLTQKVAPVILLAARGYSKNSQQLFVGTGWLQLVQVKNDT